MPLAHRGIQVLDLLHSDGLGERPLVFITHGMGNLVALPGARPKTGTVEMGHGVRPARSMRIPG